MQMIPKETLKKWGKEALIESRAFKLLPEGDSKDRLLTLYEWSERILQMTQILLKEK